MSNKKLKRRPKKTERFLDGVSRQALKEAATQHVEDMANFVAMSKLLKKTKIVFGKAGGEE